MHTCIHAYMHTCIHAYMHTCIHAYMHACIHAYIHTYIPQVVERREARVRDRPSRAAGRPTGRAPGGSGNKWFKLYIYIYICNSNNLENKRITGGGLGRAKGVLRSQPPACVSGSENRAPCGGATGSERARLLSPHRLKTHAAPHPEGKRTAPRIVATPGLPPAHARASARRAPESVQERARALRRTKGVPRKGV